MDKKYEELKEKVVQFQMMELPGQPRSMHIGTWYLDNISFGEEYER